MRFLSYCYERQLWSSLKKSDLRKPGPGVPPLCLDGLAVMSRGIEGNMVTDCARAGPLGMRAVPR